ncbi:unnamed protein product [Rotaria sordida]|uniref:Protein kinase domain-containing protein n=1 Tax=Rotaria sordida TaxID=392033 RepID=A0A814BZX7_9BILA|nr:unnamed protein product [Rotaria sordida]CAF0939629.1 unnamed protein product [Rotaria sordida]CAF1012183.1 unnamed protein product [Rotaria sordida]CAF1012821.1 unnamed protein product [Rotaria sordida]CAF3526589.1 unnamed protein product [Rotaria sordida]
MDGHSRRSRHTKGSKQSRKPHPNALRPIISGEITPQYPYQSESSITRPPGSINSDRLNAIIDDITSEGDDVRTIPSSKVSTKSTSNLVEPNSPPINDNHLSLFTLPPANIYNRDRTSSTQRPERTRRSSIKDKKCFPPISTIDDRTDPNGRRRSIGEFRRHQLTECMEYYRHCLESAQNSNTISINDDPTNNDKRKQYATTLWYDLKRYFNGINSSDENGIESEKRSIEHQRKKYLDDFYSEFTHCDFEQSHHYHDNSPIQRRHVSEFHLNYCREIDRSMEILFFKWDQILSLFPSFAALEQYDKRFDSRTREGRMFYEKLTVYQAWFNLNSEINRLILVLGRIMACTQCYMWPNVSCSSAPKLNDNATINASRPPTPSSTSSIDHKDVFGASPSNSSYYLINQTPFKHQHSTISNSSRVSTSSSFSTTPDAATTKRHHTMTSVPSMDNIYQYLTSTSPLTEYYYRYIDDQLTHARVELVASIFRSKHGPLLQRLRYIFRKEQTTSGNLIATTFDSVYKNHPLLPANIVPNDYLIDAGPDKLIDEFLTLNKQIQQQKNPNLANKKKKQNTAKYPDLVINILNRFDQNPTLTSSTFPPASAPTLVLKLLSQDRSIIKRQSYFLDYLDPTLFPHLPGSTLFPDPCTFLDNLSMNSFSPLTIDESILTAKMLTICYRLYEKHVWTDSGKFSDMFELFHLPSLYPQYVFLVQIPLDLMLAWQKYHQDRKMEQTSTTGALLLLIDECKILIHSATLIRHYIKIMITDIFEKPELRLIEDELTHFDQNIIDTMHEIISYIERYIELSLRSNLFHNCTILLKEQWKSLKQYATMMNIEELLGEKFFKMYSNIIKHFHDYIDIFHSTTAPTDTNKMEHIKKKIHRKYQKKLTIDILREAKAIYDDCALTMNIYLQKPVCRRFLLILKTARFERIKLVTEPHLHHHHHHHTHTKHDKDASPSSQCLLFAPAEYFEDNATKFQLLRTLSSSFRINTNTNSSGDSNDEQSPQTQQQSPTSSQQPTNSTIEMSPPLVYVLCVPISNELESEWRGVTHTISTNKNLTSILPLNTNWKTTTIFLLTQQTNNLEKFEESFKERLSKTNVQQNDLYNFDTKTGQILQKRSCFEKVDRAMCDLAHAIISLSNCVVNNVEQFEKIIETIDNQTSHESDIEQSEKIDTRTYVHTEELAFSFGMDIIRETSYYATQLETNTLKTQAERQLAFANLWLKFVRKKKTTTSMSKYPTTIPMWLLPGIHFLRYICSLHFTNHINDEVFNKFYENMQQTINCLHNPNVNYELKPISPNTRPRKLSKPLSTSSVRKNSYDKHQKKKYKLTKIQQLVIMDRKIDRQRFKDGLIGKIKSDDGHPIPMPSISKRMEQDLAYLKIRNFHKLNLLSRGQYATTYKCTVEPNEVLCYKQYKIQHNDANAIATVLEQLVPLMHISHENLIKYRGIALEHDHILFFMEYCSHGTIAQLLLGTSPLSSSHTDARRASSSLVCSLNDTSSVDKGIIQTTAGFAFFEEFLVQRYLRQLLSALSFLHDKEIIHRDLRNVNIFLTDSTKQSIKLGDVNLVYDFKFMKKQSSLLDMEAIANIRESIVFYAPETITQNETTVKSDIWSLGCTLVHMLTGRIPWSNPSIASSAYYWKVINWVANGVQPTIPTDLSLSNECINFLEQCFRHDPNLRPSSQELLEHPFVKEK